jgi:hypothetical protein
MTETPQRRATDALTAHTYIVAEKPRGPWATNEILSAWRQTRLRAEKTGEFRAPKKDEWFLSGAIPEAYQAYADMDVPKFHILRLVVVEVVTTEVVRKRF